MTESVKASRLIQDLFTFEKEFQYNLTLLKVKHGEVERCNMTNKTLQDAVNTNLNEIRDLKAKVRILEQSLHHTLQKRANEQQICETIINNLTAKLNEAKRKRENDLEEYDNEIKRRCDELELLHSKNLNDKDMAHKRNISKVQERLENETSSMTKLRKQLQSLMQENMTLRNKMRELESQVVPEITIYKNELKTMKSSNSNLNSEIEFLRKEHDSYHANFERIKTNNELFIKELQHKTKQITTLITENNENQVKNNMLSIQLQDSYRINSDLITRCDQYECETNRLHAQIREVKSTLETNKTKCGVAEHINFTDVVKQNRILQEIVKSVRKERDTLTEAGKADVQETERRVTRLEQLIDQLKEAAAVDRPPMDCESDTTENNDRM